jgi:predicted membrane channel-forming protein YqfA (hemolysin III family)
MAYHLLTLDFILRNSNPPVEMYLVAIAWIYVVLMMTLAEALSPQGSLLGAFFTLLGYGVLPLGIVLYVMATPHRRRARRRAESAADSAAAPDGGGQPAGDAVAPVREEP